jgi:hypothetical protein
LLLVRKDAAFAAVPFSNFLVAVLIMFFISFCIFVFLFNLAVFTDFYICLFFLMARISPNSSTLVYCGFFSSSALHVWLLGRAETRWAKGQRPAFFPIWWELFLVYDKNIWRHIEKFTNGSPLLF